MSDNPHYVLAVAAGVALLLAVIAVVVALTALRHARTAGRAVTTLAERNTAAKRPTPRPERRQHDDGPPATGERRGSHAADGDRARRRDRDDPQWSTRDDAQVEPITTELRMPPPGSIGTRR